MITRCPFPRPKTEDVATLESFLYFVWERECVRLARENDWEAPWTQDEILAKYRFCNIRRRDDHVTKWIIEQMINTYNLNDATDLWFVLAIARYVNWPPTLTELLGEGAVPFCVEEFDIKLFADTITAITKSGVKAWGSAYMIYPTHKGTGQPKGLSIAQYILAPLLEHADKIRRAVHNETSVEAVVKALTGSYGWSTFMAGQVAADLTYCEPMSNAHDLRSWAPLGPGSQLGLNFLHGNCDGHLWTQGDFNRELVSLLDEIEHELHIDDLTLHDVQNCACEFHKYVKLRRGGHSRTVYVPETRF